MNDHEFDAWASALADTELCAQVEELQIELEQTKAKLAKAEKLSEERRAWIESERYGTFCLYCNRIVSPPEDHKPDCETGRLSRKSP